MSASNAGVVPTASGSWLTPARRVMGMFFLQAAILNNWFPRIPDVQSALGLSSGELALALLAFPVGGFIGTTLAATIIEALTPRRTLIAALVVYGTAAALPGWAWNLPSLCVVTFLCGLSYVVNDVAANVETARIQASLGRRIMSTCHGFWSLGSIVGLVGGAAFAQWDIDVRWHLLLVSAVVVPIGIAVAWRLPQFKAERRPLDQRPPLLALPVLGMVGLCLFAFASVVAELTTRNWGAVFVRDALGATPAVSGVTYGAFAVAMTLMRFVGDKLTDRFGAVALGRFSGLMMIVGIASLAATNNVPLAVFGFAAVGMGVAVCMPLAITAGAQFGGGRSPAVNVAAVSLIAYTGSLVGPPLVGFIADAGGLRAGFAAILPLVALSVIFAGSLRARGSA